MVTNAIADWEVLQQLRIVDTSHPKPGEDVTLYLTGTYNDLNARFGLDAWQLAAAAVFADSEGNILGRAVGFVNSMAIAGHRGIGSTILDLVDYTPGSGQMTLNLGKMPAYPVNIVVRVFASHDNNTQWDWARDFENFEGVWDKIDEAVGYLAPVPAPPIPPTPTPEGWSIENVRITDYPQSAAPGAEINIYTSGKVNDVNAGPADQWQIAVVAAAVDTNGKPDPSLRALGYVKSRDFFSTPSLIIRDYSPNSGQMTLHLSPMPDKDMDFQVRVYANHDDRPGFTWDAWDNPVNGWDKVAVLKGTVKVVEPPNWLLIGGLVLGGAGIVTAVVLVEENKKKS